MEIDINTISTIVVDNGKLYIILSIPSGMRVVNCDRLDVSRHSNTAILSDVPNDSTLVNSGS